MSRISGRSLGLLPHIWTSFPETSVRAQLIHCPGEKVSVNQLWGERVRGEREKKSEMEESDRDREERNKEGRNGEEEPKNFFDSLN